jgi:hypothetical protein
LLRTISRNVCRANTDRPAETAQKFREDFTQRDMYLMSHGKSAKQPAELFLRRVDGSRFRGEGATPGLFFLRAKGREERW